MLPEVKGSKATQGEVRQGKTAGGVGFALNFLWLLSFCQEKESNNTRS